jgi:hypothetical protein
VPKYDQGAGPTIHSSEDFMSARDWHHAMRNSLLRPSMNTMSWHLAIKEKTTTFAHLTQHQTLSTGNQLVSQLTLHRDIHKVSQIEVDLHYLLSYTPIERYSGAAESGAMLMISSHRLSKSRLRSGIGIGHDKGSKFDIGAPALQSVGGTAVQASRGPGVPAEFDGVRYMYCGPASCN